jgi:methylisocitrate lyase
MRNTTKLRGLLARAPVLAASVYDPLSARVAELAGFEALHLTGFGVEASQIGAPDMGLMTMTEIAIHAARITDTVDIPLLSDIDTGFGGANNVCRTIRAMERAGVAGVHIEDQSFPKRCPVLEGRVIVSRDQAVGRIKAAVDARTDSDFVIVARTDADVNSIDEAIERSNLYLEAGADMAMPSFLNVDGASYFALPPAEQMAVFGRLTQGISGRVMSLGVSPPEGFTAKDMGEAGFAFIMFAGPPISAVMNALAGLYQEIRKTGTDAGYFARHPGKYVDSMAMMGALKLDHYVDIDRRFSPAA